MRTLLTRVVQRGFTIVEILIATVVIAVLAGIVIATYNGTQYRAADVSTHTDIKKLHSLVETDRLIKNSYAPELAGLGATPSINSAVQYTTNAEPYPVYENLTSDQNAELLIKVCNDIAATDPYSEEIELCAFAGSNINVKGSPCTATIKGPIQNSDDLQMLKESCDPNENELIVAANEEVRTKFIDQGGTYPIVMPTGNSHPALPEPQIIQSRASAYCLEVRSALYSPIIYSTSSINKTIASGPCTDTLPPLPPHLQSS